MLVKIHADIAFEDTFEDAKRLDVDVAQNSLW